MPNDSAHAGNSGRSSSATRKPVNDYLGEAKLKAWIGDVSAATVRRVANHSAGLPLHHQFFYEDELYRPPSPDETILRYGNLVAPPGEAFEYSNLGYGILGYIISRISGKSYADFMREEVFLPLGMTRTSVNTGPGMDKHYFVAHKIIRTKSASFTATNSSLKLDGSVVRSLEVWR